MKRAVLLMLLISGCITQTEEIPKEENRWIADDVQLQNLEEDLYDIYGNDSYDEETRVVSVILLLNSSCMECYNVNQFVDEMGSTFGFVAAQEEIEIETEEGKELVENYNITKIPTFILSEEALGYPGFEDFWTSKNNTIEDGWLVFRAVEELGAYYISLDE